jgi:hypothetical protein
VLEKLKNHPLVGLTIAVALTMLAVQIGHKLSDYAAVDGPSQPLSGQGWMLIDLASAVALSGLTVWSFVKGRSSTGRQKVVYGVTAVALTFISVFVWGSIIFVAAHL